ncbi:MAG: DUF2235 domain-containing protein [Steroidobacteraceae bacterium]
MPKRIVILSDGTGQSVGRNDSNVLRLCKLLDLSEHSDQIAIYDPGIGTHVSLKRMGSGLQLSERLQLADSNPDALLLRHLRQPFELGFGLGATANIRQLYVALVRAYEPGDDIYLFGFSRGAFTVRALAGLIYRCGVLKKQSVSQTDAALGWCEQHYTGLAPAAREQYRSQVDTFRREHSQPCNIRFLGVWDTVKSVGYLRPKNLPHTRHNPIVEHVRHALSLDEQRSFYVPTTWGGLPGERKAVYAPASFDLDATDNPPGQPQDVKEVWFPGNHADVGGGYVANEGAPANNSLRWMITEARACELKLDAARYQALFPREQDEAVTHRHDEMRDQWTRRALWGTAEYALRKELHNEPPPPRTQWRLTPAGPRQIASSLRMLPDGSLAICIHESARTAYPETSVPWGVVPRDSVRFVATDGAMSRTRSVT